MKPVKTKIPEPPIIAFGRQHLKKYKSQEYHDCLVRAFKDGGADFITLDSNMSGQRFLAAGVAWALDKEILYIDHVDTGDQTQVASFRLTKRGKEEIFA